MQNHAAPDPSELTLRRAWELFKLPELIEGDQRGTIESYNAALKRWERLTNNPPVSKIDNAKVKQFQRDCVGARLRPQTVNGTWRSIRAILRRLGPQEYRNPEGQGLIERVPYLDPLPVDRGIPRIATRDELNRLYRAAAEMGWPRTIIPPADWWRCFLVLIYNCGPRHQDLLDLKIGNFDLDRKLLDFRQGKTKNRHLMPLNAVTLAHLRRIWSPRESLLLKTGAWHKQRVREQFHNLNDRAGLKRPHLTPHDIRRSCGTAFFNVGGKELGDLALGRPIPGVASFYIDPTEKLRDAAERIEQPSAFLEIFEEPDRGESVVMHYLLNRQRTQWEFTSRSVTYRGKLVRTYAGRRDARRLAVLKALVNAGRPLSFDDLRKVVWWDRPKVARKTIKVTVSYLRDDLIASAVLDLPENWDPIPFTNGGWLLQLPSDWRG